MEYKKICKNESIIIAQWIPWQWRPWGPPDERIWETIIPVPDYPDYYWDRFTDGSGSLYGSESVVAQYDLTTREYKMNGKWYNLPDSIHGFESVKNFLMKKLFGNI